MDQLQLEQGEPDQGNEGENAENSGKNNSGKVQPEPGVGVSIQLFSPPYNQVHVW